MRWVKGRGGRTETDLAEERALEERRAGLAGLVDRADAGRRRRQGGVWRMARLGRRCGRGHSVGNGGCLGVFEGFLGVLEGL